MKVIAEYGNEDIAKVYVARMREGDADTSDEHLVEFVESIQPPLPRDKKWVLIVSSMFGCPVKCKMCDAGGGFNGRLTEDEILAQIDHVVRRRYPDGRIPTSKFKIQFARMGEPALNHSVLDAMMRLPEVYDAPGLNVSLSTVAPSTPIAESFFERLVAVKDRCYPSGRFQLQFSIHTTDRVKRDELIPIKKWSMEKIAEYCKHFTRPENGDKKVTLNFAPAVGYPIDPEIVRRHFEPSRFLIKLTPLNPTVRSVEESLASAIDPRDSGSSEELVSAFRREGFEVILSIGELEENRIGSNCGQYIQRALHTGTRPNSSYDLERYSLSSNTG
jgi:23S rRNA (adenine2503-C2)-methyltransferase